MGAASDDEAVVEVYYRLVDLILRHCNEHFPAEAKVGTEGGEIWT